VCYREEKMSTIQKATTPRAIVQMLFFIIVIPFLPLLISWRWDWREAWAYAIIYILGFVASRALAARRHPDLIAERARFMRQENVKPWDRVLAPLVSLGGGLIPMVAGLEARFDASPTFSLPLKILALAVILAGYALGSYALIENRFFSGMVRIQAERGHRVVTSGPYRWMRHPGYAGALLSYLATPLFLDSPWAFLPAALLTAALIVRTHLEDKTLQDELSGYREYAGRVRYRLIPGVW
jgi:protein-S-isoprenylcysteine O-methyltransferase Ste14